MRRRQRTLLPLLIAAALTTVGVGIFALSRVVTDDSIYFDETGYFVREPFVAYFENNGGAATFGVPLTSAYETDNGTLVQTFQNAQLQLTVRGVSLTPIGTSLGLDDDPSAAVDSAFEAFYIDVGGEALLGQPIANSRIEQDRVVQDFENARLVQDETGDVTLGPLGALYTQVYPAPRALGQANIQLTRLPAELMLNPNVSIEQPSLVAGQEQTIYVSVKDQDNQPLEDVQVLAVLSLEDARAEVEFNRTDAEGMTSATFLPPTVVPGTQVLIEVHVLHGETFKTVQSTYTQWY